MNKFSGFLEKLKGGFSLFNKRFFPKAILYLFIKYHYIINKVKWFLKECSNIIVTIVALGFSIYAMTPYASTTIDKFENLNLITIAIAGTLATILVLTYSLFMIPYQRVIEHLTPTFHKFYKEDFITKILFVVVSIFVLFSLFISIDNAIFYFSKPSVVATEILMVGITFDLIRMYQRHISMFTQPESAIIYFTKKTISSVKKTTRKNLKLLAFYYKIDRLNPDQKNVDLNNFGHYDAMFDNLLKYIIQYFSEVKEYAKKAVVSNEPSSVKIASSGITEIFKWTIITLNNEKTGLSFYHFDRITEQTCENLYTIGDWAIEKNDSASCLYIINCFYEITKETLDFENSNPKIIQANSPAFTPIYYMNLLTDKAQEVKMDDVVITTSKFYNDLCVSVNHNIILATILDYQCNYIQNYFKQSRIGFINKLSGDILQTISQKIIINNHLHDRILEKVLKRFEEIIPLALIFERSLIDTAFTYPYDISKSYSLINICERSKGLIKYDEKKEWLNPYHDFIEINDKVRSHLRNISHKNDLGNSCFSYHIIQSVEKIIPIYQKVITTPINDVITYSQELINQLSTYVGVISFIFHDNKIIKHFYAEEACGVLASISLFYFTPKITDSLLKAYYRKILTQSMDAIFSIISQYLKSGDKKNQYDIIDLFIYGWYLRIVANFNSDSLFITDIDKKIKELKIFEGEFGGDYIDALENRHKHLIDKFYDISIADRLLDKSLTILTEILDSHEHLRKINPREVVQTIIKK